MSVFNIFGDVKDKRFTKKVLPMMIIGLLMYYLFVALIGEQINILTTVLPGETGWNIGLIMNGYTIGGLIAVPATFVINTMLMKWSTKKFIIVNALILAVCVAMMGISVKIMSMMVFVVMFLIIRVLAVCIQQSSHYMCTSWFVASRGKALGFITMGAPIASASFVAIFTVLTSSRLKFTGSYYIFALLLVVLAVLTAIFYSDNPSECGLYPDGDTVEPVVQAEEKSDMTLVQLLKNPRTWMIIVAFGIIGFANNSMTAFFATSMVSREIPPTMYLPALSVGAIAGIPISYILGAIDDKVGTVKASVLLCILSVAGFVGMALVNPTSVGALVLACFGYASITGAFPNLFPSMITYIFGRKNFLGASRFIVAIQTAIGAFASQYMSLFLGKGILNFAYYGLIVMIIIAIVMILLLGVLKKKAAA